MTDRDRGRRHRALAADDFHPQLVPGRVHYPALWSHFVVGDLVVLTQSITESLISDFSPAQHRPVCRLALLS